MKTHSLQLMVAVLLCCAGLAQAATVLPDVPQICGKEIAVAGTFPMLDHWLDAYADVMAQPLDRLVKAAGNGDDRAAVAGAIKIFRTERVANTANEAVVLVESAARHNEPLALYVDGTLKTQGTLVDKDDTAAHRAFLLSAQRGFAPAMGVVAIDYMTARGVVADFKSAREWATKAIDAGYAPANQSLATIYKEGLGVPRDATIAFAYASKGAAAGDPAASFEVARAYYFGDGVERDLSKAYPLAKHAYCFGLGNAGFIVADQQLSIGTKESIDTAKRILAQLVANGDGDASLVMADIFLTAKYGQKDPDKAVFYLRTAVNDGVGRAKPRYGAALLRYGHGTDDFQKAEKLLTDAANAGDADAAYDLAIAYQRGTELKGDADRASHWMSFAAEHGSADAKKALSLQ